MGPRAGFDRCGKSRPHRDSIPPTVQPVANRYTDYVTRPTVRNMVAVKYLVSRVPMLVEANIQQ